MELNGIDMTREEFYEELRLGIIERFHHTLSEEERNIMRKNTNSELANVVRKILGGEIMDKMPRARSIEELKQERK